AATASRTAFFGAPSPIPTVQIGRNVLTSLTPYTDSFAMPSSGIRVSSMGLPMAAEFASAAAADVLRVDTVGLFSDTIQAYWQRELTMIDSASSSMWVELLLSVNDSKRVASVATTTPSSLSFTTNS